MSSFAAVERVKELIAKHNSHMALTVQAPYYNHEAYLDALAESKRPHLAQPFDKLLFSYHSIPKRHVTNFNAATKAHCLKESDCCEGCHPVHDVCYRAQCLKTTAAVVERLGLQPEQYAISFQSRLGPEKWLTPTTVRTGAHGSRRVQRALVCPAFVSHCLRRSKKSGPRQGRFYFMGRRVLELIPCMNQHPMWIDALKQMINTGLKSEMPRESAKGKLLKPTQREIQVWLVVGPAPAALAAETIPA